MAVNTSSVSSVYAPHIRSAERLSMRSLDVLLVMVPLCIFSFVNYGWRPVLLVLTGIVAAIVCEAGACLLMRRRPTLTDGTAAVTGGIIGLLMSPLSPFWLPVVAAAFAILVVKMPFGGTGRNVFNPAAAGIAFVTLSFSKELFTYPDPSPGTAVSLPLFGSLSHVVTAVSPAAQLQATGTPAYPWYSLLLGDFPGPIGAVAIAVLLAGLVYLISRRTASGLTTAAFLGTCALYALLFPRTTLPWGSNLLLELCAGYVLFAGIFMLNDPTTSPHYWLGRIVYGFLAGWLLMLMSTVTLGSPPKFEATACFAVLIVNAFSPAIDRWSWHLVYKIRHIRLRKGGKA
ncbi:MAG: RnfABCDGE type electron transport complex subunit D [Oscillospiraceae bacterium]|nr:RnfABCDGE type electron transport complex subunit D [Oscillospiraceae bacterium]